MATLVLTVIGDDRPGLVSALADVITAHGGNWERSHLAELAGKFAGIVVVTAPDASVPALTRALEPLEGLLEVEVHAAAAPAHPAAPDREITIDLLGNDHPGIVREVSAVLARHRLNVDALTTDTREAPMAGGLLFEAHVVASMPPGLDHPALQADLEELARELFVEIRVTEPDAR